MRPLAALTRKGATSPRRQTEGLSRDTAVRRIAVQLSAKALAEFNADLDTLLERTQARSSARGKSVEITIALAPTQERTA